MLVLLSKFTTISMILEQKQSLVIQLVNKVLPSEKSHTQWMSAIQTSVHFSLQTLNNCLVSKLKFWFSDTFFKMCLKTLPVWILDTQSLFGFQTQLLVFRKINSKSVWNLSPKLVFRQKGCLKSELQKSSDFRQVGISGAQISDIYCSMDFRHSTTV